ncbi:TlpA family protein disulfide reductase [Larkinella ripae]
MKEIRSLIFALIALSCSQQKPYGDPVTDPAAAVRDMDSFLRYRQKHVKLYEDFNALDATSRVIPKDRFLRQISSGKFFPVRLQSTDSSVYYRLYALGESVNQDIKTVSKYWGLEEYEHFQWEGKPLPAYEWVDQNGKRYTNESTKGKILVLKCWFINCLPCVQEMPALNEIKQKYEGRNDVLFVSLCLDARDKIDAFLTKKKFDYAVVSDQNTFLTDQLQINSYPTHFVVGKNGAVVKKVGHYQGMVYALEKELAR